MSAKETPPSPSSSTVIIGIDHTEERFRIKMILALASIQRNNTEMQNVSCPQCTLRVHPRNGACPSCGTPIQTEGTPPSLPHLHKELFSAKAIRRSQMWPATGGVFLGILSFLTLLTAMIVKGETLTPLIPLLTIAFVSCFLGTLSYLWYIRVTISVQRIDTGEMALYIRYVGGKVRKIELPVSIKHSWSSRYHPNLLLGHLLRTPRQVLTLTIEDQDRRILYAFQEKAGGTVPIPEDWPEEDFPLPREVILDCFPVPRFNLPLLKNSIDQAKDLSNR